MGVPADRSVLKNLHSTTEGDTIGEGSVVQLIGFLIRGKFSNVGTGETVNCQLPDREENDSHVNIVKDKPVMFHFLADVTFTPPAHRS